MNTLLVDAMQAYDIIMLIVLLATTFIGFRKGLAWQLASVAAIVVSYFVAVQFRDVVAAKIDTAPPWNTFLAMLILYVGTSFGIWLVFQFVRGGIDRAKLEGFDRQLGAILGLAKGGLLCVIITFFAVTLLGDAQRQKIIQSRSGFYIAQLIDKAHNVLPDELHEVLHPYLQRLDQGLDGAQPSSGMGDVLEDRIDDFRQLEDMFRGDDEQGSMFGDNSNGRGDDRFGNGFEDESRSSSQGGEFYVDPNFDQPRVPRERVADPYYRPTPR